MAVGQLDKVGAIIQARLNSSRLKAKALLPLPINSKTSILDQVIASSQGIKGLRNVILATSINNEDDILFESVNIPVYRGSEKNVLERFYEAAKKYKLNHVLRLTGDNPILLKNHVEKVIEIHLRNKNDFTFSVGLPLGCNIELISFDCLKLSNELSSEKYHQEHVTSFAYENANKFKLEQIQIKAPKINHLRLTIDYASDYALLNILFTLSGGSSIDETELERVVNDYYWLVEVNKNHQKRENISNIKDIEYAIQELEKLELNYSVRMLKKCLKKEK